MAQYFEDAQGQRVPAVITHIDIDESQGKITAKGLIKSTGAVLSIEAKATGSVNCDVTFAYVDKQGRE